MLEQDLREATHGSVPMTPLPMPLTTPPDTSMYLVIVAARRRADAADDKLTPQICDELNRYIVRDTARR